MGIYINNETDNDIKIYEDSMKTACEKVLFAEGAKAVEIGVTFITDEAVRRMNRDYRGADKVTDVLSFSSGKDPEGVLYGDIFISFDQAARQAAEIGNTIGRELVFLTVHGTLHLLGYDHENKADEEIMTAKQREIMDMLSEPLK